MTRTVPLLLPLFLLLCLALPAARARQSSAWKDLLEKRTFTEGKHSLPYRLLKPDDYDPKQKYPLVIFLHGAGERGKDNDIQLVHGVGDFAKPSARKKYPCFLIAPQCPTGEKWCNVDWSAPSHTIDPNPSTEGKLVMDLIAAMRKEFSIDSKRIYLTGLSMGGYGTWDLLARHPKLFAAAVPICGGADEETAPKIAKIPLWVFHGDKDNAVPVARSRNMVAALQKAGGTPKYTEYKNVGHDSWTPAYRDPKLMQWLFDQKKK